MKLIHSLQRIGLHLVCLVRRPGHLRFHVAGIARELPHFHA